MCKNSESTILSAAQAVETTAVAFLTSLKLISTTEGQTITTDFQTLIADIQAWKSGTPITNIEQVIADIQNGLSLLPIPEPYVAGLDIILGGLQGVLAILGANSTDTSVAANMRSAHVIAAAGVKQVEVSTGYKVSMIDRARASLGDTNVFATKYLQTWDAWAEKSNLAGYQAA